MKGIQRFLVIYGVTITAFCLYFAVLSYQIVDDRSVDPGVSAEPVSTSATETLNVSNGSSHYYLAVRTGQVVILKDDDVFETTGIEEKDMSDELREEVRQKISFESAEEVYAFLESCSS